MRIYLAGLAELFASTPAALTSHLVAGLSLALFASLQLIQNNKTADGAKMRRGAMGAGILLGIQLVQMVFTVFYLKGIALSAVSMGLVDQLSLALTIVWVVWLCLESDQHSMFNRSAAMLSLALLFSMTLSIMLTLLMPGLQAEQGNLLNLLWFLGNFLLLIIGIILLAVQRPTHWLIDVLILALTGLGLLFQILAVGNQLELMGLVRLSQAISLPWLLVLTGRRASASGPEDLVQSDLPDDTKPVDTKPELVKQLLEINLTGSYEEKVKATVRALSLSIVVDICYLVRLTPNNETVEMMAGYDLIREINLPPAVLQPEQLLHIMDAWADQRTLNLSQTRGDLRDADTLTLLLKYHRIGSLMAFPLHFADQATLGGLILLSPYTNKRWGTETVQLLEKIQATLTDVLFGPDPLEELRLENEQQVLTISDLKQSSNQLSHDLQEKEHNLNSLLITLQQLKARYQLEKYDSVKQIDAMQTELAELKGQPGQNTESERQLEQIQAEIRQMSSEREDLRASLARANARIQHLENMTGQTGPIRLSTDNQIISLDSIAANARLQIAAKLQQAAQTLEIHNPDGRQMVKTDPELLGTILQGLIENAIAASPNQGTIQLNQSLSLETGMLIAEITDHGEGLSPEEQSALFGAAQTAVPGIGDLSAIRQAIRAVRLLHGKVWLRSKKNSHTTFRIQLPVRIID